MVEQMYCKVAFYFGSFQSSCSSKTFIPIKIMRTIFVSIFWLFYTLAFCQSIVIQDIGSYFMNTDTCNAYLACKVRTGYSGCWILGTSLNVQDDTLSLAVCYGSGSAASTCTRYDTFCLGNVLNGAYKIQFIASHTYNYVDCIVAEQRDSAYTTLQIGSVGISEANNSKLKVYPNPAEGSLHCSLAANKLSGTYAIHNLHGVMVTGNTAIHQPNFDIDISQLPCGIYYLTLQDDKQCYVKKFVKQ